MSSSAVRKTQSLVEKLTEKQLQRVPEPQPYYYFMDGEWRAITTGVKQQNISFETKTGLRLITWNIDFMAPFAEA